MPDRIDTSRIQPNLLELIGRDTRLRKAASTNGGEWAGPCPWCGGNDRFRVWPDAKPPGWWCRQCGRGGDGIRYVMLKENVGFVEACKRLGAQTTDRPVVLPRERDPEPEPTPAPPAWGQNGLELVKGCEAALWSGAGERARAWLANRGLKAATLKEFRIGYVDHDGATAGPFGIPLDRGIVIPTLGVDGALWGISVRRPQGEPKYKQARGSRHALVGRLEGWPLLLLAEGPFDMMLAWQEAGDLMDVATLGSCSVQPSAYWLPYLVPYKRILLAYDLDDGGDQGAQRWAKWCERSARVRLPLAEGEGKDITDFWKAGGDLRSWVGMLAAAYESGERAPSVSEMAQEWEEGEL